MTDNHIDQMSKLQQKLVDFATQKGQAEAYTKQAQRAEQDARAVAEKSPSGQIDALTIENKQWSATFNIGYSRKPKNFILS